jgi:Uma2 family endonuclease
MVAVEKQPPVRERAQGDGSPWRFSLEQYQRLVELGVLGDARVELVNGVICEMSPTGPMHEETLMQLDELLKQALGKRAYVRIQMSLVVDGAQLVPDVAAVERRSHANEVPRRAFLVAEVADSSLAYDRGAKAECYARGDVAEYWVVGVRDRIVEVHTEIVEGRYTRVTPYKPGETIRPLAFPDVAIAVADLFA